ncbi:MAG: DsrE family protein [Hyphomicrobiales bacterium]|nr:DsrE family protein [Hyphomicrobiales bacterium]
MDLQSDNPVRDDEPRRVILHVNFNDPDSLNYVLNNAENIDSYYSDAGKAVEIRIVAHGPGLHMLRDDTSPVKQRLQSMAADLESLSFYACANTRARMAKAEGKEPEIVSEAAMVPSGIVEIMELQRAGWLYLKP